MTIHRGNIDEWLFNHFEGNLSAAETRQLQSFIKNNLEFADDLQAWNNSFVEESVPSFNSSLLIKDLGQLQKRNRRVAAAMLALLLIGSTSAYFMFETNNVSVVAQSTSLMPTTKLKASNEFGTNANNKSNVFPEKINSASFNSGTSALNNYTTAVTFNVIANNNNNLNLKSNDLINTVDQNPKVLISNNIEINLNSLSRNENSNNFAKSFSPSYLNEMISGNSSSNFSSEEMELAYIPGEEKNDKIGPVWNQYGRPHDLNPDELLKNKNEIKEKSNDVATTDKKFSYNPEKGMRFTNLKNIIVIQPLSFDFENNSSLISQHYAVDGYSGYSNNYSTGNKVSSQTFTIGGSQYFRKINTTIDIRGNYNKSQFVNRSGVSVTGAMKIKLDRRQSIVPSIGFTYDQYNFLGTSNWASAGNNGGVNINNSISYYDFQIQKITGSSVMRQYQSAGKINLNTGILYHNQRFYASLGVNGLLFPTFTYIENDRKRSVANYPTLNFMAGTDLISKRHLELSFSPQISINIRNIDPIVYGGGNTRYRGYIIGGAIGSDGSITAVAGINKRNITLQYRIMFDKTDELYGNIAGNYISAHFNLRGLIKKQKAILDDEK